MRFSISSTIPSPQFFQPNITERSINLHTIEKANGNINQIVSLINENKETCLALFREALEQENSIAQIQLSQAYCEINWRENEPKDSVSTQNENFDPFFYYPREFDLFIKTYRAAMRREPDYETEKQIAEQTFWEAADQGYLPAFLEFTDKMWGNETKSYGFALQLRPFVNQGNKVIDYHFGMALKHGSEPGTKLFYEGLHWIHKSDGIPVQFPEENESFENFSSRFCEKSRYSYYSHDGFIYANEGSPILAPSREKWEAFIKEKIETAEIAPKESYAFPYNAKKLLPLVRDIGTGNCKQFEVSPTGQELVNDYETKVRGFSIHSLSLYDGNEKIGTISVRKNTSTDNKYPFEIYKTVTNQRLQPVIDLIENVMIRTGSTCSAESWVRYLKEREYFSRRAVKPWSYHLKREEYSSRLY